MRTHCDTEAQSCGLPNSWVYTYTISAPTVVIPAGGSSTVACPSDAVAPTPPVVTDNCGRTITPTGPAVSADPPCAGARKNTRLYSSHTVISYAGFCLYTISA